MHTFCYLGGINMPNELLLILSLLITFSFVLAAFYFFKEQGLFLWTTIATIAANIEVLIIVNGNDVGQHPVCFDIFSNRYPK